MLRGKELNHKKSSRNICRVSNWCVGQKTLELTEEQSKGIGSNLSPNREQDEWMWESRDMSSGQNCIMSLLLNVVGQQSKAALTMHWDDGPMQSSMEGCAIATKDGFQQHPKSQRTLARAQVHS